MCRYEYPCLKRLGTNADQTEEICIETIFITSSHFSIGRSDKASLPILNVLISRNHCVIKKNGASWTITDFSKYGSKVNNQTLEKEQERPLNHGDIITLDLSGTFNYKFYLPGQMSPAKKKMKLSNNSVRSDKIDFESHCNKRCSEVQEKMHAAQVEQSNIQEKQDHLRSSYEKKIQDLEHKFGAEREKMEQKNMEGELQQKSMEKDREAMEERLRLEKEQIKEQFESEKMALQRKVEEQREIEMKLKEENEMLLSQIESKRQEFEQRLALERREHEENMLKEEKARLKAEEEKAEVESRLLGCLEQLKEQQEADKNSFNQQLVKESLDNQKLQDEHLKVTQKLKEQEMSAAQHLNEKQILEEKLRVMEQALKEKNEQQEALSRELARKEEEKTQELESLRAQKEAENQRIRDEMNYRENAMRSQLDSEIDRLKNDKLKLEADIRVEMNVESLENKNRYEKELDKVKKQLSLMEGKKHVLEAQLANNTQEKEKMTETCVKAKQKVLEDVGEMMQSELQCQICSELFVVATTLNCTHTFCRQCICNWKKKQTKKVADCPICRAPIKSENRSIVLDNFIDKMVESLSEDLKEQRKQLLLERAQATASTSGASTSNARPAAVVAQAAHYFTLDHQGRTVLMTQVPAAQATAAVPPGQIITLQGPAQAAQAAQVRIHVRQRGGHRTVRGGRRQHQAVQPPPAGQQAAGQAQNPDRAAQSAPRQAPRAGPATQAAPRPGPALQPAANANIAGSAATAQASRAPVIVIDSPQRNPAAGNVNERVPPNTTYISSEDSTDGEDDELVVAGLPTAEYGGFGRCFHCGMKGHWAPGCPFHSR